MKRFRSIGAVSVATAGVLAASLVSPGAAHAGGQSIPLTYNATTGVSYRFYASTNTFCISSSFRNQRVIFSWARGSVVVPIRTPYGYVKNGFSGPMGTTTCGRLIVPDNRYISFQLQGYKGYTRIDSQWFQLWT